ncbi:MAG: prolyl oligopeptidase family serine peptidase [Candidatus Cloacimonetes bacterium]|nr:prolyl oligopeptidase family serine peptidase [Candidatus Cloacimonadota bacterium]
MKKLELKYPHTPKEDVAEVLHGTRIEDPYRWLEDDKSPRTAEWLKKQQKVTESVLDLYPGRKAMFERLKELNNYPRQSVPIKIGEWYYFSRNEGLQNQYITYRKKKDGEEELFFDPNTLSPDGTTQAYISGRSKDKRYATYNIAESGADNSEYWVMDTETKTFLKDKITNVRGFGTPWYKDGFFYSKSEGVQDYQAQDKNHRIFYHKLGEDESQDTLIWEDPENPLRYHSASVSDDEKYLFLMGFQGTGGTSIRFRKVDEPDAPWICLFEGYDYDAYIFDAYEEDCFYLMTNKNAKNFRLLKVNLLKPEEENWEEIIPQRDYLLRAADLVGGKLIITFIKDVYSHIEVFDPDGNFLYPIQMPYLGSASLSYHEKEDEEAYFYFSSYVRPNESYHYEVASNKLTFYHRDPVKADFADLIVNQVFYPSKDGTLIPMSLIHKKDLPQDGNNPVYLYGYGGFQISMEPYFSSTQMALLEKGFIVAIANLRGGNEYGESWHEAGMLLNKQNVFDDFIAAAEYLIQENYTNPDKIAINGGSNGGLLVGACLTQRPDLFRVAVPSVGVLDMLRFHKFTLGWGWMTEYGNPDKEEDFHNLLSYSPLHNVKDGVKYPATMIATADHDDRVVPGHSFKFAATMQAKATDENPALLYVQFESSHGSSNLTKSLEMWADIYSFMCLYLE